MQILLAWAKIMVSKRMNVLLFAFLTFNLVSAQNRMIPAEIGIDVGARGYRSALLDNFAVEDSRKFAFLIVPSFCGECYLTYNIEKSSLKLKWAKRSIWSEQKWYNRKESKRTRNKIVPSLDYELVISDSLSTALHSMVKSIVLTSTYLQDKVDGLDGTTYYFILDPAYTGKAAECWTPREDTNCGQAVALLEKLCDAVTDGDSEQAEKMISEVVRVTELFRQYYPADFKER